MKKAIPWLLFAALFFIILYTVLFAMHRMSNNTMTDTWHVSFERPFDDNTWTYDIEQLTKEPLDIQSIQLLHHNEELIHIEQFEEGTTIEDFKMLLHPFYLQSATNVVEKGETYTLIIRYKQHDALKRDVLTIK